MTSAGRDIVRQFKVVGEPSGEDDNNEVIKVAFATDDGRHVNQHFGTAKSLVIYKVQPECHYLVEAAEFEGIANQSSNDKLAAKIDFLDDCLAVYCRACGASALKQLQAKHIQPLKVVDQVLIKRLITALQQELAEQPPKWLSQALSLRAERRHDAQNKSNSTLTN